MTSSYKLGTHFRRTRTSVGDINTPLHVGIEDRCHVSEDGKVVYLTADKTVKRNSDSLLGVNVEGYPHTPITSV